MSAIEITATSSAQPESSSAQPTQPEVSNAQPQGGQLAADDAGKGKVAKPSGSAFAALDRRQRAVEKAEQEFQAKLAEFEKRQSSLPDIEKTDPLELLENIAKKRGVDPDALIKEYITRKTGGPAPAVALAQSTDPAIIALREQLKKDAEDKENLRKQLEERDSREEERQRAAADRAAQAACLESSKAVYIDGSDYAFFWDIPELLASDVQSACERELSEYIKQYRTQPDFEDVQEMVREMPKELLKKRLESHAGQRILELKKRAELPPPPAPVTGFKPLLRAADKHKKPEIKTRLDNDQRLEDAIARWPKGVPLPGQQPNSG